jgi:hypothetical protein
VAIGIGSLQKAPVALLFVATTLVVARLAPRHFGEEGDRFWANVEFRGACLLALILVVWWPALQLVWYGSDVIKSAFVDEMAARFSPFGDAKAQASWSNGLWREAVLWAPALILLMLGPWLLKSWQSLVILVLVACFLTVMATASGKVYGRYVLLILPLLAAHSAATAARLIPGAVSLLVTGGLVLAAGPLLKNSEDLQLHDSTQTQHLGMYARFASSVANDESIVLCRWARPKDEMYAAAISHYASRGRPLVVLDRPEKLPGQIANGFVPPYRGLCTKAEFDQLRSSLVDYSIVEEATGYVHWSSKGVQPYQIGRAQIATRSRSN